MLIASGMLEAVWAAALSASRGFSRRGPTLLFLVSLLASTAGLGYAMTGIPTGTSYAVWVGIGATLTAVWGVATGQERATLARLLLLILLIGSIIGLQVVA